MTIKRATVKDGQITKITNDGMTTFLGTGDSDGRTVLLSTIGAAASGEVYLTNLKTNESSKLDIKKAKTKDGFSVGRLKPCDYIIDDETISRLHAKIFCIDGIFFIEDFSSNGTYIAKDEEFKTVFRLPKESKVELLDGCYISFAEENYRFSIYKQTVLWGLGYYPSPLMYFCFPSDPFSLNDGKICDRVKQTRIC